MTDNDLEQATTKHKAEALLFGEGSSAAAAMLGDIGQVHYENGEAAAALAIFEEQRRLTVGSYGPLHPGVAIPLLNMGAARSDLGELNKSFEHNTATLRLIEGACGANEGACGANDIRSTAIHNNIGAVLSERGDFEATRESILKGLQLREETLGKSHAATGSSVLNRAEVTESIGEEREALSLFARAHDILSDNDPANAGALDALGGRVRLHRALGEREAAAPLEAQLLRLRETAEPEPEQP